MRFTYRNWVELSTPRTRARTYGPALVLCGLQLSLPVLAWIHALALQPKAEGHTQGFTPSYVIEPHVEKRPTFEQLHLNWQCDHTELQRLPFYYLNYVLMFYVQLTGQNYCQELKWFVLQLQNKEIIKCHQRFFCDWNDCPMKVRTIVLFFDLLQFLWECCPKIIFDSIYVLLV